MRAHIRHQARRITHALDDARHKRRAVQLVHLLRHGNVHVDQRLVVGDHVLVLVGGGALEGVGGAGEEVPPQGRGDELEEGEDAVGAGGEGLGARGGRAVQEEGEEAQADRVALFVEAAGG